MSKSADSISLLLEQDDASGEFKALEGKKKDSHNKYIFFKARWRRASAREKKGRKKEKMYQIKKKTTI